MQQKKIYCGSGKKKKENWLQITVNPEKFADYIQEYNGSKFVKLNISILDKPNEYGKDVQVSVDTWKPNQNTENNSYDLPF